MVERSRAMAFAGGALVFPGGRIDPGDHLLAATLQVEDADEAAARIAAIRETLEEAGVAIGLDPLPDPVTLATIRAGLHAGEGFAELLAVAGVSIALDALVPFARWLPNHPIARVFDTRFYLARLPDGAEPASVDHIENVRLIWTTPRDILEDGAAGAVKLIFPTLRNLERLAQHGSFDEAVADALSHPVRTIVPTIEVRNGVEHLCIPDGLGYPVVSFELDQAMRG